jgi:hypothetical protein
VIVGRLVLPMALVASHAAQAAGMFVQVRFRGPELRCVNQGRDGWTRGQPGLLIWSAQGLAAALEPAKYLQCATLVRSLPAFDS